MCVYVFVHEACHDCYELSKYKTNASKYAMILTIGEEGIARSLSLICIFICIFAGLKLVEAIQECRKPLLFLYVLSAVPGTSFKISYVRENEKQ